MTQMGMNLSERNIDGLMNTMRSAAADMPGVTAGDMTIMMGAMQAQRRGLGRTPDDIAVLAREHALSARAMKETLNISSEEQFAGAVQAMMAHGVRGENFGRTAQLAAMTSRSMGMGMDESLGLVLSGGVQANMARLPMQVGREAAANAAFAYQGARILGFSDTQEEIAGGPAVVQANIANVMMGQLRSPQSMRAMAVAMERGGGRLDPSIYAEALASREFPSTEISDKYLKDTHNRADMLRQAGNQSIHLWGEYVNLRRNQGGGEEALKNHLREQGLSAEVTQSLLDVEGLQTRQLQANIEHGAERVMSIHNEPAFMIIARELGASGRSASSAMVSLGKAGMGSLKDLYLYSPINMQTRFSLEELGKVEGKETRHMALYLGEGVMAVPGAGEMEQDLRKLGIEGADKYFTNEGADLAGLTEHISKMDLSEDGAARKQGEAIAVITHAMRERGMGEISKVLGPEQTKAFVEKLSGEKDVQFITQSGQRMAEVLRGIKGVDEDKIKKFQAAFAEDDTFQSSIAAALPVGQLKFGARGDIQTLDVIALDKGQKDRGVSAPSGDLAGATREASDALKKVATILEKNGGGGGGGRKTQNETDLARQARRQTGL